MLRHERQTVAVELAAALHHSRDVGLGWYKGLRAQTVASQEEEEEEASSLSSPLTQQVAYAEVAGLSLRIFVLFCSGGDFRLCIAGNCRTTLVVSCVRWRVPGFLFTVC